SPVAVSDGLGSGSRFEASGAPDRHSSSRPGATSRRVGGSGDWGVGGYRKPVVAPARKAILRALRVGAGDQLTGFRDATRTLPGWPHAHLHSRSRYVPDTRSDLR